MFADGTNIFFRSNSFDSLYKVANSEMVNIDNWLIANKPAINVNKTKHIVFRTSNNKLPPPGLKIVLRNKHIERVSTVKFLGLTVHEHLSLRPHMEGY